MTAAMQEGAVMEGPDRGGSVRDTQPNASDTPREPRPPWRVEGARIDAPVDGGWLASWRRPGGGRFWWILLLMFAVNWLVSSLALTPPARVDVSYTTFREQVQSGNVAEVVATGDRIEGTFRNPMSTAPGDGPQRNVAFQTQRPSFADDGLMTLLVDNKVTVNARPPYSVPLWQQVLLGFGPTILLVALLVWAARRAQGPGFGGLGRSRATRYEPDTGPRTSFEDIAGIEDVESEVREIVDFLMNPDRYRRLGATAPKGVLLSGPPGTGKTLLARAVAGEARVPFYSVSAAEFIEMIVGVGASRVRDLFEQAKKSAPAIIFIDELDSVGRARGGTASIGGHDEREQTLNQILTEMDGFDGNEGVVVMAATNRPEILDPALLRPGRFDRRVTVNPPDKAGRLAILRVHTRHVPLGEDVDLAMIAASTPGMVGADLRNLINEAAIAAARRGGEQVQMRDVTNALEKILLGTQRQIVMPPHERERTAYHEAGHALLGMLTPGADPVRKISVVPRGMALGVTLQSPETDRYGYTSSYLRGRLAGALGGRAAEQLVYGETTTGAENDLEQATKLARQMVGRWGMSELLGPVSVLAPPGQEPALLTAVQGPATRTLELVDEETRRLLEQCYENAVTVLTEYRVQLDRLAHALLERETLDADEAYAAAGLPAPGCTPATSG